MASFFENKDRNVIPNWRSFELTAKLGETNDFYLSSRGSTHTVDLSDLFDDWENSKSIGVAGDLLSSASVLNYKKDHKIIEVSKFIIQNEQQASPQLISLAKKNINNDKDEKINSFIMDLDSIEIFKEYSNLEIIFFRINNFKKQLIRNPNNAIVWVELSRLYSILGQNIKAERAMKNALQLSNENRFVLRSMVRFFAHMGDIEFAHDILRKNATTEFDSWLMASEISLALMRGRGSKFMKKGIEIVNSKKSSPFNISELASSIATSELHHGGFKKSKDFFKISLIQPNDNALAQAEWASQKESSLNAVNPSVFNLVNSFEALARDCFEKNMFEESYQYAIKWFLDMPFSTSPILFASYVAGSLLKQHEKAIEIATAGLLSHSKDHRILNNLIFNLCMLNRLEEAEKFLERANQIPINNDTNKICLTATRGLYFFRKGFPDIGRKLYKDAIEIASTNNNKYLFNLAFVNFCREEVILNSEYAANLVISLESVLKGEFSNDIISIKNDILSIWGSQKSEII